MTDNKKLDIADMIFGVGCAGLAITNAFVPSAVASICLGLCVLMSIISGRKWRKAALHTSALLQESVGLLHKIFPDSKKE